MDVKTVFFFNGNFNKISTCPTWLSQMNVLIRKAMKSS